VALGEAAHRDEHPLARRQHVVIGDRPLHLAPAQLLGVLGTEVGVVPREVDDRRPPADAALHVAPPEITTRHIYVGIIPFVLIQLVMLAVLWFAPGLATALPHLLYGS
jgi:TRAP-type C4-dicarboxylate transport system permease large subunit